MHIEDYQKLSRRTMNKDLSYEQKLSNMAMGIAGEGGEIIDLIKKAQFQGHTLDTVKIKEEIGDLMWYVCNLATLVGADMGEVLQHNFNKLLTRYPNGFSEEDSMIRRDKQD